MNSSRITSLLNLIVKTPFLFILFLFPASLVAAEPQAFDRLTFHAAPKPLSAQAKTEDWPRFLGPRHDLHSKETKLLKSWPASGPKMAWEVKRGTGHAPAVVSGDYLVMIHAMEGREVIECLQLETGKRHWKYEYPVRLGSNFGTSDAPRSAPVIDGDLVFTVGVRSDLHCLNLKTGDLVWKVNLDKKYGPAPLFFGRGSCPLIDGDQLIVNVGGKFCVASFKKRTGDLIWSRVHAWHASYASPVPATIHGKKRILVFAGGKLDPPAGGLLSLDPKSGKLDDSFPWRARMFASVNAASPVVIGNSVFVTESYTEGGALVDFAPDGSARLRWKAKRFGSQFTTPVAHDGYLYGIDGTAGTEMVCYEIAAGREMWRDGIEIEGARLGRASLLHVDGAFLCLGAQGTLLWLDLTPKGARILAQAQLFRAPETWGVPTVSRGLLFVNQNAMGSRLICYDLRDK
jgi:outer membrane protein assembly factor BamB